MAYLMTPRKPNRRVYLNKVDVTETCLAYSHDRVLLVAVTASGQKILTSKGKIYRIYLVGQVEVFEADA